MRRRSEFGVCAFHPIVFTSQDQPASAHVLKKRLQYLEHPEELHRNGEEDDGLIYLSSIYLAFYLSVNLALYLSVYQFLTPYTYINQSKWLSTYHIILLTVSVSIDLTI